MSKRREQGATLALIITLAFVIVLIGVGFFFYSKIIGGGKELQHATDSGNLNVARAVLKRPGLALNPGDESNEFGDLIDPVTNEANLLTFNRLVGKSVLVSINAQAMGSNQARVHATALYNMLEGPNGLGSRLATRISTHNQITGFFDALSNLNSTRMLQNGNANSQIQNTAAQTPVSFMARGAASNTYIAANQIPAGAAFTLGAPNVVTKTVGGTSRTYLAGYVPLATGLNAAQPMAVPVRPGEQPHLVSVDDFHLPANTTPPLGTVGNSLIPPNTFRSDAQASENNQTGSNVLTRSCAIVGALNVDFPVSIPRGFIVVDNTGDGTLGPFNGNIGNGVDIFSTKMMTPNHIDIAILPSGTKVISDQPSAIENIQAKLQAGEPVPQSMLSAITSPSNISQSDLQLLKNASVTECNNVNAFTNPNCKNNLETFFNLYGNPSGNNNVSLNNLMAIEEFKCYILKVRAGFAMDGGGCGMASAPNVCTGLKSYTHGATYCLPCNFGGVGTLRGLLAQTGSGAVENDLRVRMRQIKPTATEGEIGAVMNSAVPFGQVTFIYMNTAGNLVLDANYPYPRPTLAQGVLPDGNMQPYTSGNFNLNGSVVNVPGCEGYPNPWDCPAIPAEGEDRAQWIPSSGYRNLLGLLRLLNCAHGGGNWCCPC
ncbi:MAG: hypothetical protein K2W82_02130 [Candidatus Obscuribacterales bacterium]|nr:hypothetical protein [Candidatus Obscuribacterales bacterium]